MPAAQRRRTRVITGTGKGQGRRRAVGLKALVTVTGGAVMAIEFGAQRLLAPFFGSSQLVWGLLIGLVLLALSVGYHWGGRLADRRPRWSWLGGIVLFAGLWTALVPTMAEPLLTATAAGLLATPAGVVVGSLVGVVALFLPPLTALGMVSPFAVRLALSDIEGAGTTAGALYAFATLGSLLGTFVPVFIAIPDYGVRATFWGTAVALVAAGSLAIGRFALITLAGLPLGLAATHPPLLKPVPGLIAEVETPYQFAQVYRLSNGEVALSVNDGAGIQSVYASGRLTGLYYDALAVLPYAFSPRRHLSALVLGMGAGTIPTLWRRDVDPYRAPIGVVGVEIDPVLTALGRRYFHLQADAARVVHADARVFLEGSRQRFDLIVVDAYSNEIYIPFTLTTRQFFQLVRDHLAPQGMVAMNVNAVSSRAPLLLDMERTLKAVFSNVAVARAPGAFNYLLVAGNRPLPALDPSAMPPFLRPTAEALDRTWHSVHPGAGLIFTDNRAPVDALTDQMIWSRLTRALSQRSSARAP